MNAAECNPVAGVHADPHTCGLRPPAEADDHEMRRLLDVLQVAVGNATQHARGHYAADVVCGLVADLASLDRKVGEVFDALEDGVYDEERIS